MVSAPGPASRASVRRGSGGNHAGYGGRGSGTGGGGNTVASNEKEVGQFVLGKTMGEGTFGEVKLAVHKPTSERVAAKVLEKSRIKTIADVKRVSREIKILKRVRHPNVIALYEVLDTPSAIYFMMEHCDGGELFDYIVRHQRLQEPQACFFFRQLVDGIEYLHEHDVTHRDLKPENLLLQSSADGWCLKIIDFGLSNTHEGGKLLRTACGSPCYAAPEMIAGKSYRGPVADVWSCGVVLFTLVAGFLPFEDPNTSALYKKILSGSYEPPQWLSDGAVHLLSRILETDPVERATIPEIRAHLWYVGPNVPPPPASSQAAPLPNPAVPVRRADIDDKLLASAVALAGGGGGGGVRGAEGSAAIVDATTADVAAEGILSGRHDPVGTAYHLLLKRHLRGRKAPRASVTGGARTGVVGVGEGGRGQSFCESGQKEKTSVAAARATAVAACSAIVSNASGKIAVSDNARLVAGVRVGVAGAEPPAATQASSKTISAVNASAPDMSTSAAGGKGNASCASSTSSSRSGRSIARRRNSGATAIAGGSAATAVSRTPVNARGNRPRARSASASRPSYRSPETEAYTRGGMWRETREAYDGDGVTAEINGEARQPAQSSQRHHAVPLLSLRGIGKGERSTSTRAGEATTLSVSQTARTRPTSRDAGALEAASTKHGSSHPRRESGGSCNSSASSSGGGGGGGGGSSYRRTERVKPAPPRRPLTARAPLKSSAPTPRLSADFNLSRPMGPAIAVGAGGGENDAGAMTISGPRPTTIGVRRARPSTEGMAALLSARHSKTVVTAVTPARENPSKESEVSSAQPVGESASTAASTTRASAPSPHHRNQPSLRVRLSTLTTQNARSPQQQQQQQQQQQKSAEKDGQMTAVVPTASTDVPVRSSLPSSNHASSAAGDGANAQHAAVATMTAQSSEAKPMNLVTTVATASAATVAAVAAAVGRGGRRQPWGSSSSGNGRAPIAMKINVGGGVAGGGISSGGVVRPPHASSKAWRGSSSSARALSGSGDARHGGHAVGSVAVSRVDPAVVVEGYRQRLEV